MLYWQIQRLLNFSRKLTITVDEAQQVPHIEKIDSKKENSCPKWTIYTGRQKSNFKTDTDKLNFVVNRYRNKLYHKDNEIDMKLTKYEAFVAKRVYLLSCIDISFKRCIFLDETTVLK